ncbi:MAG: hypothetical protein JST11_01755 [Acidobacteria bacterium]|nr:hypothetical protein [Acidobacteriota bacterium]
MMLLLMAAVLPSLLWDAPPDTAPALRDAGIVRVQVPAARYEAWKGVSGIQVESVDLRGVARLSPPGVQYRMNEASATRMPWLMCNGWRFLRNPKGPYYYDVQGPKAALAAAEAFCFGGAAMVRADSAGIKPLAGMLGFLGGLGANDTPTVADIGFLDDGSSTAGEVMNLMVRYNLLFRRVSRPDPQLKLNVRLGSKEFPLNLAKNPGMMAHEIRAQLTDEKRSLRVYGSAVVVARLTVSPDGLRVHLLNYAGAERKVDGIRVRVPGRYTKHRVAAEGSPQVELLDYLADADATEFTLPELKTYAVIDLSR